MNDTAAKRVIDQRVEIDLPPLTATAARMLQHARDNAVSALAMLGNLFEIAGDCRNQLVDFGLLVVAE